MPNRVVVLSGSTGKDIRAEEELVKRGILHPLSCYVCKRRFGDDTFRMVDGDSDVEKLRFHVYGFTFRFDGEEASYQFILCFECRLVLEALAKTLPSIDDFAVTMDGYVTVEDNPEFEDDPES